MATKYRYSSARETAEKQKSADFGPSTVALPEGVSMFRLKSDKTVKIDILPFKVGAGNPNADEGTIHYERTYWAHRNVGPNEETVVCIGKTANKKCPICSLRAKLAKDPGADEDDVKALNSKQRQLFAVIDCNDREKGIQIWDMSYFLFGELLNKYITESEDDEGWEKFFHPTEGMSLKLGISEENMSGNTYYEVKTITLVPRKKQYKESIIDKVPCLDDILRILDTDELKKKLEDDDEDSGSKKSKKKSRSRDEDEDEEDEEDDEDEDVPYGDDEDDEEEDEKPRKKKSKVSDDDEDDEDEDSDEDSDEDDDEDDDEDEKPSKKSKKSKASDDEDEDEDEDDEDDSDEDEDEDSDEDDEDEKPRKKKSKKTDDEDDDEDEDEDFEEDLPPRRKK